MQSFSRTQFPPGGWEFYSPQTKWAAPNPKANTFGQQVVHILNHRLKNPAAVVQHNLLVDVTAIGNELENYTRARLGMPPMGAGAPKPTPPITLPQMSGAVAAGVAAVKKLAAGAALLLEWEESGLPPVAPELSAKRAAICASCPKNDPGGFGKYFTASVSENLRKRLSRLHQMNLTTPSDDKLEVCSACLCPLKLKVHTPLALIIKRLKPEFRAELDARCWILANT